MKHLQILIIALGLISLSTSAMATEKSVSSPDGQLIVTISDQGGTPTYRIDFCGCEVLMPSALGMQTSLGDLTKGLTIVNATTKSVADDYQLDRIKTSSVSYRANQLDVTFQRTDSIKFIVRFQVSNNDVAFRYEIPRPKANNPKRMTIFKEATAFRLPTGSTTFLCPQIGPETGWENTKPSYEEDYEANMPMDKASKFGLGYTFPCLFSLAGANTVTEKGWKEAWMLIGETGVSSAYCGSHLSDFTNGQYSIAFPHRGENNGFGSEYAVVPLPGKTPWRTITVGQTLRPIVETTVAYDVVEPQYEAPKYKPGRYTWSWLIWQDASINYDDQVKFIDLASTMGFEYCLVDNWWDAQIGRDRIEDLSRYAQSKGVSLMLWYNSNGYINDAPQTPRDCMNTAIAREKEMTWLQKIGVKGIKVDFFGGDKQETMRLYEDILSDANRHGLQVVFHGCTIPRGWERMYPNYVASEAALASENVFFDARHAKAEGFELTMHPFCRNALGAFDWGGVIMNRYMSRDNKSRHPRYTSDVFEMATAFTNQTFIQCVAMQPNNLEELPDFELEFLRRIPTTWDETRFIEGYPSKYVVMARRHGSDWYVAGLNGTDKPITLQLSLDAFYTSATPLYVYNDNTRKKGEIVPSSYRKPLKPNGKGHVKLTIQPMGGFIISK